MLFGLPVQGMFPATRAILTQFHSTGIVATVFLRGIIPFLAFRASKGDDRTNIFLFRCHGSFSPATDWPPLLLLL